VQDYESDIVADRGGIANVSAAEQRTIEIAKVSRTCWLLALAQVGEEGMYRGSKIAPAFSELRLFQANELKALTALGLEKRAPKQIALAEYIEAQYGEPGEGSETP